LEKKAMEVTSVRERFLEESNNLQKYLEFIQEKTKVTVEEIELINFVLKLCGIRDIKFKKNIFTALPLDELESVNKQLQDLDDTIKTSIAQREEELLELFKGYPFLIDLENDSVFDDEYDGDDDEISDFEDEKRDLQSCINEFEYGQSEWGTSYTEFVNNLRELLEDDQSNEKIESVRKTTFQQNTDTKEKHSIDNAIWDALIILKEEKLSFLKIACMKTDNIILSCRMYQPGAEINILKQGFILLMTLFDATIFDLIRVALHKDFFGLIGILDRKDQVKIKEFSNYSSFDEFRDGVVEQQLKQRYLTDILELLKNEGVKYVVDSSGFSSIHLREMIRRRNIHIHNRGLVDEKYLELGKNKTPKHNIYKFALGDVADIDNTYWEMATQLCNDCVEHVAHWVDTLEN
jgi:hypothetical protein